MSHSDTVEVKCPVCGVVNDYRADAGSVSLLGHKPPDIGSRTYSLKNAPLLFLIELQYAGETGRLDCMKCGARIRISLSTKARAYTKPDSED